MKKIFLSLMICIPFGLIASDILPASPDTILYTEGKKIELKDNEDRLKVRIYDINKDGEEEEDELIFEGHYKDGSSYEKRRYPKSITIPLPSWHKGFDPHWSGFGMGFANFADNELHINDIDGVTLDSSKSLEYNLNLLSKGFRISRRYNWAVVTGVGMRWSRYRLDGNEYFERVNGKTILVPAPKGIHIKTSKLNITSLTFPLLLEWQNSKRKDKDFFISAGVVGVVKTASSSKIVYRDEHNKKRKDKIDEGLYLRPISMDFLVQAGYDWIGFYAKYSPIRQFEGGKGPKVHPVSVGLHFYFL